MEAGLSIWRLVASRFAPGLRAEYAQLTHLTLGALEQQAEARYRVIVDSSKTGWKDMWRPLAIRSSGRYNLRIVHVVRDPRGTLWSVCKTKLRSRLNYGLPGQLIVARTLIGLTLSNTAAALLALILPRDMYLRIRYEDIAARPQEEFARLTRFLDISPLKWVADCEIIGGGHQAYGNHMRSTVRLVVKLDEEWEERLPAGYRVATKLVAWPWLLRS